MAVNDQATVVAIVRQEGLANPAKIVVVLLIQRPQGIYASVDKQAPAIIMPVDEGFEPVDVMRRQIGR